MQRAVMRQDPVLMNRPEAKSARALKRIAFLLEDSDAEEEKNRGGIARLFSSVIRMRFMK